jgi:Domain of unknown function (DUF4186)
VGSADTHSIEKIMREPGELFEALRTSRFRTRFRLNTREARYLQRKGFETVLEEARQFVQARLSAAHPVNDGKQTPMRNHPVFIAQHATATCCRGCIEKWHGIPRGRGLLRAEEDYIINIISRWLTSHQATLHHEQRFHKGATLFDP